MLRKPFLCLLLAVSSVWGISGAVAGKPNLVPVSRRVLDAATGHLVVVKKSEGYIWAEHPDSRVGIHIKTSDANVKAGNYIYVHGTVKTDNSEKLIEADSIEVQTSGWGMLPPTK